MKDLSKKPYAWILVAALLAVTAHDLRSADTPSRFLSVDTAVGFSGRFALDSFVPLTVTVENRGDEIRGILSVETKLGFRYQTVRVSRRSVVIPGRSRKRFAFTVFIERNTTPLTVRITAEDGETVHEERIILPLQPGDAPLVVALSRRTNLDSVSRAAFAVGMTVAYPHPETVPFRWDGYDGAACVVLHDAVLTNVGTDQAEALAQWVSGGGTVVFTSGAGAAARYGSFSGLLPGRPSGGPVIVPAGGAASTLSGPMAGLVTPDAFPRAITPIGEIRGEILLAAGTVPLVVRMRYGEGSAYLLAYDPAAASDDLLWERILGESGRRVGAAAEGPDVPLLDSILEKPLVAFPPRLPLLVFLAVYSSAVILALRVPRLGATAVLIAAAVFGASGWYLYNRHLQGPDLLALDVAVYSSSGAGGYGFVRRDTMIVSAAGGNYRLDFGGEPPAMVIPEPDTGITLSEDRGTKVEDIVVGRWKRRAYRSTAPFDPRISGVISEEGIVRYTSTDGGRLTDPLIYYAGRLYVPEVTRADGNFGTVVEGRIKIAPTSIPGTGGIEWSEYVGAGESQRERRIILRSIVEDLEPDRVYLIAGIEPAAGTAARTAAGAPFHRIAEYRFVVIGVRLPEGRDDAA